MTQPLTSAEKLANIARGHKKVSELREETLEHIRTIEKSFEEISKKHQDAIRQAMLVVSGAETLIRGYIEDAKVAIAEAQREASQ